MSGVELSQIVAKIIIAKTRFGSLVGECAELDEATKATVINDEVAFVVPLADRAVANQLDNEIQQTVTESFAIVAALRNDNAARQKLGRGAINLKNTVRDQLFKAILGWLPSGAENPIEYAGGRLLDFNRAWFWWQYEFSVDIRLTQCDGYDLETPPDMFNTFYAQYILQPNVAMLPYTGTLPVDSDLVDEQQSVSFITPGGPFNKGFSLGFERYGERNR